MKKLFTLNFTLITFVLLSAFTSLSTAIGKFPPRDGEAIELWRITNNPAVRDHANYHNTQCWSPDGRYIGYTHYAANEREYGSRSAAEIHLFDTFLQKDILIDHGTNPRWANTKNWLFYTRHNPEAGPSYGKGTEVVWLDVDSKQNKRIAYGVRTLKETDYRDRWLYGIQRLENGSRKAVRIPIEQDSKPEILPGDWGAGYNSLYVNPAHPVIVSRDHNYRDYYFSRESERNIPFVARHFFDNDLDGENRTKPFPLMNGSHFSWNGDGSYFMAGNGPTRGKKWTEALPCNIHILSIASVGDICPCGRSGRWICGSTGGGRGPLQVADLRSGDAWVATKTYSFLCFPNERDNSGPYDIDAKGSPDGTKIVFVSTYDLKDSPAAEVTGDLANNRIPVQSTQGFPPQGRLVNASGFGGEVLSYESKTATSFNSIKRGLYGTSSKSSIRKGRTLTSFESLLLPESKRNEGILPPGSIRNVVQDMDSPLMWQRSSDIYIAVVRLPDRPFLRNNKDHIKLIPGENHYETYGYHFLLNGKQVSKKPLRPGEIFTPHNEGKLTVVAVEWSGLESKPSHAIEVTDNSRIHILMDTPKDFSWTQQRYYVKDSPVDKKKAMSSKSAREDTVHCYDGVIHKSWYEEGVKVRQDDLNAHGKAIRRLTFTKRKLNKREYYNRNGDLINEECFDADGFITDSIRYSGSNVSSHWQYNQGVPIKFSNRSHTYVNKNGTWIKRNN